MGPDRPQPRSCIWVIVDVTLHHPLHDPTPRYYPVDWCGRARWLPFRSANGQLHPPGVVILPLGRPVWLARWPPQLFRSFFVGLAFAHLAAVSVKRLLSSGRAASNAASSLSRLPRWLPVPVPVGACLASRGGGVRPSAGCTRRGVPSGLLAQPAPSQGLLMQWCTAMFSEMSISVTQQRRGFHVASEASFFPASVRLHFFRNTRTSLSSLSSLRRRWTLLRLVRPREGPVSRWRWFRKRGIPG